MIDYGDKECSAFYRVHVKLEDPESESHLIFDFPDRNGHPYKTAGGEMTYDERIKRNIPKGQD